MIKRNISSKKRELEAIGKMTSGVMHNFNNLMGIILARTHSLKKKIQSSPYGKDLDVIQKTALEAARVAQRIQKVSLVNGNYGKKEWVNMNELLADVAEITESSRHEKILISFQFQIVPRVFIWVIPIREVFLNIFLNAIEAIGQKEGTIVVQTETQKKQMKISISDNGIGMSSGTLQQLFKPFFTTKIQGSGLGLSTSHDIIKKHRGTLTIQSTPGVGTTIMLTLPISKRAESTIKKARPSIPSKASMIKQILLVDDECDYRQATAEFLLGEGYIVDQAASGKEALEKTKKQSYDLVISDIRMPKISGNTLAKKIKIQHKKTKIILISGMNEKLNQAQMKSLKVDGWLVKPCLFEDIAAAIKRTCH